MQRGFMLLTGYSELLTLLLAGLPHRPHLVAMRRYRLGYLAHLRSNLSAAARDRPRHLRAMRRQNVQPRALASLNGLDLRVQGNETHFLRDSLHSRRQPLG